MIKIYFNLLKKLFIINILKFLIWKNSLIINKKNILNYKLIFNKNVNQLPLNNYNAKVI